MSCAKTERLDTLNIQFLSQNLPNTHMAFTVLAPTVTLSGRSWFTYFAGGETEARECGDPLTWHTDNLVRPPPGPPTPYPHLKGGLPTRGQVSKEAERENNWK